MPYRETGALGGSGSGTLTANELRALLESGAAKVRGGKIILRSDPETAPPSEPEPDAFLDSLGTRPRPRPDERDRRVAVLILAGGILLVMLASLFLS